MELGGVVVHHADGIQPARNVLRVALGISDLCNDHPSRMSRADDQRALQVFHLALAREAEERCLKGKAEQQHAEQRDEEKNQKEHLARRHLQQLQQSVARAEAQRRGNAAHDVIMYVKVAPEPRIGTEYPQHQLTGQDVDQDKIKQVAARLHMEPVGERKEIVQRDAADSDNENIRKHEHKLTKIQLLHVVLLPISAHLYLLGTKRACIIRYITHRIIIAHYV